MPAEATEHVDTDDVTVAPSNPTRTGGVLKAGRSSPEDFTFLAQIHLSAYRFMTPNANTVYHELLYLLIPYNAAFSPC